MLISQSDVYYLRWVGIQGPFALPDDPVFDMIKNVYDIDFLHINVSVMNSELTQLQTLDSIKMKIAGWVMFISGFLE